MSAKGYEINVHVSKCTFSLSKCTSHCKKLVLITSCQQISYLPSVHSACCSSVVAAGGLVGTSETGGCWPAVEK